MATIQFENGVSVEFDGTPTQADIEEVSKRFTKPAAQQQAGLWNDFKTTAGQLNKQLEGFSVDMLRGITGPPARLVDRLITPGRPTPPVPYPKFMGGPMPVSNTGKSIAGDVVQTALGVLPFTKIGAAAFASKPVLSSTVLGGGIGAGAGMSEDKSALGITGQGVAGAAGGAALGKWSSATVPVPEDKIIGQFTKSIRPTVVGKTTAAQVDKYNARAVDAVKSIVENKKNLLLPDEYGNMVAKLPESLSDFSQAIAQTKAKYFEQYNAMQQAAGKSGATVDLAPISTELEKIASSAVVKDMQPSVAQYAQDMAATLGERRLYTTDEAQAAIAQLNAKLQAYYKNPTYENATKSSVDAMIANRMRAGLDESITKATEPGYQGLKNKFGALSEIEKDVNHRAIVDARKNEKGLIDYTDFFSAANVVKGIASGDPSLMAAGATSKALSAWYKHRVNPNTIVRKMFKKAEMIDPMEPIIPQP